MKTIGSLNVAVSSECSIILSNGSPVCILPDTLDTIASTLQLDGAKEEIVEKAKVATKCGTQRCLVEKFSKNPKIEMLVFKQSGPVDDTLVSNFDIDRKIMQQFKLKFPEFFAYNFHMMDYDKYRYDYARGGVVNGADQLATLPFDKLYKNGYKCCGCIINSDVYHGQGKHWMALFADARADDRWTVEFFNSSGQPPKLPWIAWMEKTIRAQQQIKPDAVIKSVIYNKVHQKSKTECGIYSIFYIWARLNNIPVEFFYNNNILDKLMFEFRQHIFSDNNGAKDYITDGKFDWATYQKKHNIKLSY